MEEKLRAAIPSLVGWFRLNKRDLPWRRERTPYTALVAEIMLQQTRVEAAREKYVAFLEKFPTADALARAAEDEVLKAWEGLGYYSRARSLHACAKIVAERGFPQTFEGVLALPGVGEYTAGAVSSIALGLKTPAVDGNVRRVLARFFGDGREQDEKVRREYRAVLEKVYPENAGEFTEALMELGALVCLPNGVPLCGNCPWRELCAAHAEGKETSLPLLPGKRARRVEEGTVLVFTHGGKFALQRREKGLLSRLYGFPFIGGECDPKAYGVPLAKKKARHVFTHVEWRMTGYLVETKEEIGGYIWATPQEIAERYPIPSAFGAFLSWLEFLPVDNGAGF